MTDKTTLIRYGLASRQDDLCGWVEIGPIQGGKYVQFEAAHAIEQERDMLLAAIDSDDVNWLTALRDIRRAMKGYKK